MSRANRFATRVPRWSPGIREAGREARNRPNDGVPRFGRASRIFRLAVPVPPSDPLVWLGAQINAAPRLYWNGRGEDLEIAAVGAADVFADERGSDYRTVLWRLKSFIASGDADVRYYGGMRFDPSAPVSEEWRSFDTYQFLLPAF